jgi:SAM-dependent methyltransferase
VAKDDDLLWRHLRDVPAFRALLRAIEARFYERLQPLDEPVLDLGCGDGHFASVAFARPLDAGIDPDGRVLRETVRRGVYLLTAQSVGDALPFGEQCFATVISNSVLEHIPEVEPVLSEIARVLQTGGRLIFCVPSDRFGELLFFSQLLRSLRLEGLAEGYRRTFNRVSRHHHCDSPAVWQARLARAHLRLTDVFYYFSEQALHALEFGHFLGVPSLISKKLFGRWILAPTRWNLCLTEHCLRPLYEESLPEVGAYLFLVAQKD